MTCKVGKCHKPRSNWRQKQVLLIRPFFLVGDYCWTLGLRDPPKFPKPSELILKNRIVTLVYNTK